MLIVKSKEQMSKPKSTYIVYFHTSDFLKKSLLKANHIQEKMKKKISWSMSTVAQPAQTLSLWASIPLYMIWPQCEVFYWIRVLKNNFCHLIILILYTLNPSLAFLRLLSLSKNILFWESFWYYYHGLMFIHVVICSNKIGRTIKFHFVILGHKKILCSNNFKLILLILW